MEIIFFNIMCVALFLVGFILYLADKSVFDWIVMALSMIIFFVFLAGLIMFRNNLFETRLGIEPPFIFTGYAILPIDLFASLFIITLTSVFGRICDWKAKNKPHPDLKTRTT